MRIAIYGRVSTSHQVEHQTIEQQIERLTRAMAKEMPTSRQPRPVRTHDRSTGIAVRPTRAGDAAPDRRRAS